MTTRRGVSRQVKPLFAWCQLQIRRSRIDRWGVFAAETIPPGRKVIQYTGERITNKELMRRAAKLWLAGKLKRTYTVNVNRRWVIDGSAGGSGAELINHSCNPNLTARKRRGQIFLYSLKRIREGEELTANYGFRCVCPCHCGSANCRGTMCQE